MLCHCSNQLGAMHLRRDTCSEGPSTRPADSPNFPPEQMAVVQNNLEAMLAGNGQPMETATVSSLLAIPPANAGLKKRREKVLANGFIMTFDKESSRKKAKFWRCEFKNQCNARLHTDQKNEFIINSIHKHNHPPVAEEELRLYGFDPPTLEAGRLYVVNTTVDSTQRRRIRRKVAEQRMSASIEPIRYGQPTTSGLLLPTNTGSSSAVPVGSNLGQQSLPATLQIPAMAYNPMADPDVQVRLEQLTNLLRMLETPPPPPPDIQLPKKTSTPTEYMRFYIALSDGSNENRFTSLYMKNREEDTLREVLENFSGQRLIGQRFIVLDVRPKIMVKLETGFISDWENDQFFLLNTSSPSKWKLKFLDEQTARGIFQ